MRLTADVSDSGIYYTYTHLHSLMKKHSKRFIQRLRWIVVWRINYTHFVEIYLRAQLDTVNDFTHNMLHTDTHMRNPKYYIIEYISQKMLGF